MINIKTKLVQNVIQVMFLIKKKRITQPLSIQNFN